MEDLLALKTPTDKVLEYTKDFFAFLDNQAGWSTIFSGLQVHYGPAAEMDRHEALKVKSVADKLKLELDYQIFTSWEVCDRYDSPGDFSPEIQVHPTLAAQMLFGKYFWNFIFYYNSFFFFFFIF